MATNQQAIIRYQTLDKCFRDFGKKFHIETLVSACNEAIYQITGIEEGVKKRQVYDDINFMMSPQGWNIPLEKYKDGRRTYYRYSDKSFSINKQPLTGAEINQFKDVIFMLSRFKGVQDFEWIDEVVSKFEDKFHLIDNPESVIELDRNQYLKGSEYFAEIFNSIVNKKCLKIVYSSSNGEEIVWDIHPYYLKQYNSRWFLLGINDVYKTMINIPLDKIESISMSEVEYIPTDVNFDEYFKDVVGVSVPKNGKTENVRLKFSEERFQYIVSKPIHSSQRTLDLFQPIVDITVIPNNELISLLLSFGNDVEILAPQSLREDIRKILTDAVGKY